MESKIVGPDCFTEVAAKARERYPELRADAFDYCPTCACRFICTICGCCSDHCVCASFSVTDEQRGAFDADMEDGPSMCVLDNIRHFSEKKPVSDGGA